MATAQESKYGNTSLSDNASAVVGNVYNHYTYHIYVSGSNAAVDVLETVKSVQNATTRSLFSTSRQESDGVVPPIDRSGTISGLDSSEDAGYRLSHERAQALCLFQQFCDLVEDDDTIDLRGFCMQESDLWNISPEDIMPYHHSGISIFTVHTAECFALLEFVRSKLSDDGSSLAVWNMYPNSNLQTNWILYLCQNPSVQARWTNMRRKMKPIPHEFMSAREWSRFVDVLATMWHGVAFE